MNSIWRQSIRAQRRLLPFLTQRASIASFACRTPRKNGELTPSIHLKRTTMSITTGSKNHFETTSGATDAVWVHLDEYGNRAGADIKPLASDIEADVCIIGSGIAGVSIAYELVTRGKQVVMLEARELLSGETGRTSGHLSNALDDGYLEIKKKHGKDGAKAAAESHTWALNYVGEVSQKLGIDCEYRKLPGYMISQYARNDPKHAEDLEEVKQEVEFAKELGLDVEFREGLTVKGWSAEPGRPDQRDGAIWHGQATFHPTKYLNGILQFLLQQPNFKCYPQTRVMSVDEPGIEILGIGNKHVEVKTQNGHIVKCDHAVEATNVPLQKLSVVAEMEYNRTYCIAIRVPKGSVEDCLLYDTAEEYKYVRMTACDDKNDYMVIGGCDHKVGQEDPFGRFEELETWVRERFPQAGTVDYKWSGQVFEPVDYMAFIGLNQAQKRTFIVTGDSGNGLTHGVIAGRLIADEIDGAENSWAKLYSPKRKASILGSAATMISHDLQINSQYKRLLQSDITDIEDLVPGSGGVLNPKTSKPIAVYKDESGKVTKVSALCPHMKGVVCWNGVEKSWDCPVHGSRFSKDGLCVEGPSKGNLEPVK
ncbi:FAD dependent oxidoreductase [Colletotrichum truncatum]|uniref:FAD dependent oxidoreductase n=1 Tax=Colletotrichum truncatum TaxID=5467 RepID=A0ACC3ZEZ4_COLTU|nr:FAD dependent oxidoreductase [Colletotrichum truncatum]KAF6801600.1 FAD dependent oxidoreductase [Colletotrichum truncatum]